MSLSIIGAGFGRTRTLSLKYALEQLGVGPCYHMTTIFPDPEAPALWERAFDHQSVDWDQIFKGYGATVDFPGCYFYRELAEHYPQAKVILTLREADAWFDSTQATIFSSTTLEAFRGFRIRPMIEKMTSTVFGDDLHDRAALICVYQRHNAQVQNMIPASRLLIYEVSQGWGPLCGFLGRPIPDAEFPRVNARTDQLRDPETKQDFLSQVHAGRSPQVP